MVKFNEGFSRVPKNYLFEEMAALAYQKQAQLAALRELGTTDINYLIKLAIGDPDLPTPSPIMEAMHNETNPDLTIGKYHGYPDSVGTKESQQALAEYYTGRFPRKREYNPDDFVVGFGAKTDLWDLVHVLTDKGDDVASFDPAYPVFVNRALFEGLNVKYLSAKKENNFLPLPTDQFSSEELDNLKVLYLCLPNNPTGVDANKSYLKEHVKSAIEHDYTIIFDSAYIDFCEEPFAPNIMQISGAEEVAIDIGSFSKPFSMTGDRVSWVFAEGEIIKNWKKWKGNRDSGTSNYIQKGAYAALTDPRVPPIVQDNMKRYEKRKTLMVKRFNEMKLECEKRRVSPYVWFETPERFKSSKEFSGLLLDKAAVLVTPGSGFGPSGEGYARSTIFNKFNLIEEACNRIEKVQKSKDGW